MLRYRLLVVIFIISVILNSYAEDNSTPLPEETVTKFHDKLLTIMKNSTTLGYQGRYNELSEIIPGIFNMPLISQVILGRYWNELTAEQQANFISLYTKLVIATYADRFDGFDNESFNTVKTEDLNRGRLLVKTELHTSDGETITLDYLMSQADNDWMVISVIADGANDISIKRGEYSDVIKNDGYDSLLIQIQNKITEAEN